MNLGSFSTGRRHRSSSPDHDPFLPALLERIRGGESRAEAEFISIYADGIRFFLRRRLGPKDLDERARLVSEVVLEKIRRGWVPQRGGLMELAREAIESCGFEPAGSAVSAARVRGTVDLLKTVFRDLTECELELLSRYYLHGEDARRAAENLGMTEVDFEALKRKISHPGRTRPRRLAAAAGE